MSKLPKLDGVWGWLWTADSYVSSWVFEAADGVRRGARAYASFVHGFRISGLRRAAVDVLDDCATFATAAACGLLAFALPPFTGTGDVWNKGRDYAITLTDANGEIVGRRGIRQDDAIPLEDIPKHVIDAVLATEDSRFYSHFGVDIQGTLRALVENARANDVVQGGSSLTQQVAKNLFLTPERSMRRKVHEAFLALWIEARLSKDEIIKLYLDRSYLGGGNYGVEAAAQFYFGKSIRDVSVAEAAMLAGLFKAPTKYAPHRNIGAGWSRANIVLDRMLEENFITLGEFTAARRSVPHIVNQAAFDSPDWFLDWAYRETLDLVEKQGITSDFVLEVKTTIDTKLQDSEQRIVNDVLATEAPAWGATQAASVTMEPGGAIRAIVGGKDYEESQFNRATDALRQTGSAFKPFVYLTALMAGFKPSSVILDGPVNVGNWSPKNYSGKYAGRTTLTNALAHSYNSVPVRLMLETGRKAIVETARLAGIRGDLENWPPMVLGTSSLSLLDVTTGYATLAAGGIQSQPYSVLEIRRPTGELLYSRDRNAAVALRTLPEDKVAELNSMMSAVVTSGTGGRALLGFMPQAGKTGTNQGYRDAWFIGFTGNNVTGVWFGNDDFTPMRELTGGKLPAATWKRIMLEAERGRQRVALPGLPLEERYLEVAFEDVAAETAAQYASVTPPADTIAVSPPEPAIVVPRPTIVDTAPAPARKRAAAPPPIRKQAAKPKPATGDLKVVKPKRQAARVRQIDTEEQVVRPRERRDPVIEAFKDMFGLLDRDENEPRQKVRKRKADTLFFLPQPNTRKKKKKNAALDLLRKRQDER